MPGINENEYTNVPILLLNLISDYLYKNVEQIKM
jgi:hypothetical protein